MDSASQGEQRLDADLGIAGFTQLQAGGDLGFKFRSQHPFAEDHDADVVGFEVQRHALHAVGEFDHLARLDVVEAVDARDAVADRQHLPHFGDFGFRIEIADFAFQNGGDFGRLNVHGLKSLHGGAQAVELGAQG